MVKSKQLIIIILLLCESFLACDSKQRFAEKKLNSILQCSVQDYVRYDSMQEHWVAFNGNGEKFVVFNILNTNDLLRNIGATSQPLPHVNCSFINENIKKYIQEGEILYYLQKNNQEEIHVFINTTYRKVVLYHIVL